MPLCPRLFVVVLACAACATASPSPPVTAAPAAARQAHEPEVEHSFVSTSHNDVPRTAKNDKKAAGAAGDFAITTPEAAKQLAETAVAEQLDPKKTWQTSPVLPTSWPAREHKVVFFFYPLAANPRSMTQFQLFSAAWQVEVSLQDGATAVLPLAKSRALGTVAQTRPSSLERRELEIAESALVQRLVGAEIDDAESPYWGYLKFMHEHPELGKDLQRRSPTFLGWVRKRYGK